jgi:hypothetical protein
MRDCRARRRAQPGRAQASLRASASGNISTMVREQVYLWLLGAVAVTAIGGCGGITMPGPEGNVPGTGGTTSEGGIHVGTPDSRWIDTGMSSDCTYSTGSCAAPLTSWSCTAPPAPTAGCRLSQDGVYCCPGSCVRDWTDTSGECPFPNVLLKCQQGAPTLQRCTPNGTAKVFQCCQP